MQGIGVGIDRKITLATTHIFIVIIIIIVDMSGMSVRVIDTNSHGFNHSHGLIMVVFVSAKPIGTMAVFLQQALLLNGTRGVNEDTPTLERAIRTFKAISSSSLSISIFRIQIK